MFFKNILVIRTDISSRQVIPSFEVLKENEKSDEQMVQNYFHKNNNNVNTDGYLRLSTKIFIGARCN